MNAHDAYMAEFIKTAGESGVDVSSIFGIEKRAAGFQNGGADIIDAIKRTYHELDPYQRRAVIGGLIAGLGTAAMSDGPASNRLLNGVIGGTAGGLGIYGLDRSGITDGAIDFVQNNIDKLRPGRRSYFT